MRFDRLGPDDVTVAWDYAGEKPNPVTPEGWPSYSTGPTITSSEHFTLYVSAKDLADPSLSTVRSRGSFARMSQRWPFMKMGHSPLRDATLFGRMFTHKGLAGYGEAPPKILAYMEKHAPRYLEVPEGWSAAEGAGSAKRLDTWMAFADDVPPETPGYAWTQQPMEPGLAPPTGLAAKFRS